MSSGKNKLNKKLEALKKKKEITSIPLVESDVLNENISFDNEDPTFATRPKSIDLAEESASATQVYNSQSDDAEKDDGTAVIESEDHTIASSPHAQTREHETTHREITSGRSKRQDREKTVYGDIYKADQNSSAEGDSVEGILKQAEHLRLAQEKINELEGEVEDLRRENDEVLSAADTFKALSEEYYEQMDRLKNELLNSRETAQQENKILKESLTEKDKQIYELKQSNADLKSKVEANFKQIRKRERDLEYRLELIKVEDATLLKSKDKTIIELRRRIDKLDQEMQAYREKNKEHYEKLQQQQQTVRGVVRALRIALTRLEGDFGVDFEVFKKAE